MITSGERLDLEAFSNIAIGAKRGVRSVPMRSVCVPTIHIGLVITNYQFSFKFKRRRMDEEWWEAAGGSFLRLRIVSVAFANFFATNHQPRNITRNITRLMHAGLYLFYFREKKFGTIYNVSYLKYLT